MERDDLVFLAKLAEQAERWTTQLSVVVININVIICWCLFFLSQFSRHHQFNFLFLWSPIVLFLLSILPFLCRFDEMVDHMKAVAQQPQELTVEVSRRQ